MKRPILAPEAYVDISFPLGGVDLSMGFQSQRRGTTPFGLNVRAFEPVTNRGRGGQRAGLSKYIPAQVSGANVVQEVNYVSGFGYDPPGGSMQTSESGRVVTVVAVSQGNVLVANAGDTAWTAATSGTGALKTTGVIQSASNNQKLWFADGTNWKYYDPSDNTVKTWTASVGSLPVDDEDNKPRLICTWRGRTVLSGLLKDGQNWFMSAVNDPTDFDYSPASISPTQAIAGNNSPTGMVGDVITTLIPYTDDVMIFGGDHTIWMLSGDPMMGGQLDQVSGAIGMAWGNPWCTDPYGNIYFFSNRTGIYTMVPGQQPQRISQAIEQFLFNVDTGANTIRMIWDDRFQGLHVFITPTAGATAAMHFFFERRTGGWWSDVFANNNHNPLCCCTFDGNTPGDRQPLIGSWDGYVRSISPTASDDDGTQILSSVVMGPILTKDMDDVLIKDLQAILGEDSGDVDYQVYVGQTAEGALSSEAVSSGTWNKGSNVANLIRRAGRAIYVKITSSSPWALEKVRARVAGTGKVRRRGR